MGKMKLTPEQKAVFEYGRAYENFRKSYSVYQISKEKLDDLDAYKSIITSSNRDALKRYIKIAKQKRSACRAWVPVEERYCDNCRRYKSPESIHTCTECSKWADPVNWEPRKEGE